MGVISYRIPDIVLERGAVHGPGVSDVSDVPTVVIGSLTAFDERGFHADFVSRQRVALL